MAIIMHDESDAMFSWKGDSIEEYCDCILNALIQTKDDGKGHRPELVVYDGGYTNLLIREGKKAGVLFPKDGTIPDPISTENVEFKIFRTIIKHQLEGGETDKWNNIVNTCTRLSDDNFTRVHHL